MSRTGQRIANSKARPGRGFTTVELLVVLAILAVLLTLAVPSFSQAVARYRLMRASEDLVASLYLLRSEAIRLGGAVVIERSQPGDCAGQPGKADKGRWDCGWCIYQDSNGNGQPEPDELLHTSPRANQVEIFHRNAQNRFSVNRWGDLNAMGFGFEARAGGQTVQRTVCTQGAGRLRTVDGSTAC